LELIRTRGTPEGDGPARTDFVAQIKAALEQNRVTVLSGARGLGQIASIRLATQSVPGWECVFADGAWLWGGYVAGLHELIMELLAWAEVAAPQLVARHEQTLKRVFPERASAAYLTPSDLTNGSDRDERTRFYHHEYQNKLLVGLAEFMFHALSASGRAIVLVIDNAAGLSPTSRNLIGIIARRQPAGALLKFVLLDRSGEGCTPPGSTIHFPAYPVAEFEAQLDMAGIPRMQRDLIYELSGGNLYIGYALKHCVVQGMELACGLSAQSVVDFYLASLPDSDRTGMAADYIRAGFKGSLLAARNLETIASAQFDEEHIHQHQRALEIYKSGAGPLVVAHGLLISDKYRRAEALVEASTILMRIGLYDTWFAFFARMFADPDLRAYGDGDGAVNGLFINAAFVLYSMGNARASAPFLDEFLQRFPKSRFAPTVLYAQSMTYGRYRHPIDLDRAEMYARRNLALIDEHFRTHHKYHYIKVFAENAYAYIKARQGQFGEALELCEHGNLEIVASYGETSYRLHRSILIYNTSQVYEIIGDHERAEERLKQAIASDPYYAEYWNDLGNLLCKIDGRQSEALEAYARAIALSPPYYEAHLNRGILLSELGDCLGALADFERVLEIKPQEWRAWREIGNARLARGDASAARDAYCRALEYEQGDADLQANAGLAASETGDADIAIGHYNAAISLNPKHAEAHNNLAAELVKRGFYCEALAHARCGAEHGKDSEFATNRDAIEALYKQRQVDLANPCPH
jgi:tetratricopeptide (TPR) repeat protein